MPGTGSTYIPQRRKTALPIGTIFQSVLPQQSNWLLCDGSEVNGEYFPELRDITVNTPDLRPRDPAGNLFNEYISGSYLQGYGTYIPHYIIGRIQGGIPGEPW